MNGRVQGAVGHDRYVVVVELQLLDALQRRDEIGRQAPQKVVRQVESLQLGEVRQRGAGHGHDAVVGQVQVRQRGRRPEPVVLEHVNLVVVERQRHDALEPGEGAAPHAVELVVRERYDLQVRQPGQRVGPELSGQQVGAEVQVDQRPQALQMGCRGGLEQVVLQSQHFQKRQVDERVRANVMDRVVAQIQKRQVWRSLQGEKKT